MKQSQFFKFGILALIAIAVVTLIASLISYSNEEVVLRNQFNQKITERTAFYDNMWKTLNQKGQIALKNDSSFRRNIELIMAGRKDAEGTVMKWIVESNPNANFTEVSSMYKDLSRAVEAKRDEFFEQEKMLQDIKLQHDNLLSIFPGSLVMSLFGRQPLQYKPITSDRTDEVMETGKDNNTQVF